MLQVVFPPWIFCETFAILYPSSPGTNTWVMENFPLHLKLWHSILLTFLSTSQVSVSSCYHPSGNIWSTFFPVRKLRDVETRLTYNDSLGSWGVPFLSFRLHFFEFWGWEALEPRRSERWVKAFSRSLLASIAQEKVQELPAVNCKCKKECNRVFCF